MPRKPHAVIRDSFNMTADERNLMRVSNDTTPAQNFSRAASGNLTTDRHLARPGVPERAKGLDYSGKTMARYINGLEARLIDHMRKHAPHWQAGEAARVLNRWHAPASRHPAPTWATARDTMGDAHDFAAALLRERVIGRLQRLGDIRIARTLGGYRQADPLHLIFHNRSPRHAEPAQEQAITPQNRNLFFQYRHMFLYCSQQCQPGKDRQMVDKKKRKGRKALTDGLNFGDNRGSNRANVQSPDADPRIVALVRMLARKAAERDYPRFVRRNEPRITICRKRNKP